MENIGLAPNQDRMVKARYDDLNRSLATYRTSGEFDICGNKNSETRERRETDTTMSALMASFNAQATETAPANVRSITARDQHQIAGVVTAALIDDLTRDSANGSALKSLGRGFKRIFGGRD